ncbi:unnamed protein product [Lota lota]
MTKTKVDVHSSPSQLSASPKERRLLLRHKMENGGGTGSSDNGQMQHAMAEQQHQPDPTAGGAAALSVQSVGDNKKKKINRAPSPARPKDVPGWSLTKPALSVKPGAIHLGSRASRRNPAGSPGGKESKLEKHGAGRQTGRAPTSSQTKSPGGKTGKSALRRKTSDASTGSDDLSKDSGCAAEKLSPTDSSSELSDCASEGNKVSTDAASSDTESRSSRGGGTDGEKPVRDGGVFFSDMASRQQAARNAMEKERLSVETGDESMSPGEERSATSFDSRVPASTSLAFSDLTEELVDGLQEEFVREIEELRSENDYLKDEMEELRSEMLEMRDMYLEEDVYQLQELRQQLEQANKTCRILQYRLRKAERRSVRVAQTGQVDGELIRTLEQDVKVAKDVSIRVHGELDSVEKKRGRLEQENEELRVRLQDMEVAKQVLQQEMDKNPQKKRSVRPNNKPEKKLCPQEDSADLKCQLHFAKEESALMCKKLTRLVKDSEAMKEELAKYRSLYGDVDASLTVEEVADSPHTREAEVRVHLKLVEEEANLLSRRIVELEVENRGLRAEMDDMKGPQDEPHDLTGMNGNMGAGLVLGGGSMVIGGGASSENVMELQRHLQFVEEEAELLRRSLIELEEQNKLLMNEINRYKSELPPSGPALASSTPGSPLSNGGLGDTIQEGAELISTEATPQEQEMREARIQIGDLNGKVKKLQYENRVLLSNLQRCDLASYHSPSSSSSSSAPTLPPLALETCGPAGDASDCLPSSPLHREGPVGGENNHLETRDKRSNQVDNSSTVTSLPACLRFKDHDALLAMREQARLVSMAIQLLTIPTESNCLSPSSLYHVVCQEEPAGSCDHQEKPQNQMSELSDLAERPLVAALTSRLQALHSQLQVFVERVDSLGGSPVGDRDPQVEGASPQTLLPEGRDSSLGATPSRLPLCPADSQDKKPDSSDQLECKVKGQEEETSQSDQAEHNQKMNHTEHQEKEPDETPSPSGGVCGTGPGLQAPAKEGVLEKGHQSVTDQALQLKQLQEDHQKALMRRDFQLQSIGLQARLQHKLWRQERTLLLQESQHLKQSLLLTSVKLRCFLKHWRLGHKMAVDGSDILEVNSLKELYLLLEEEKHLTSPAHFQAAAEEQPRSPTIKWGGVCSTLADLRGALQGLSGELRLERQGSQELTQQFARAKASWEVERNELKSLITQLENKTGKASNILSSTEALDPLDLKVALKREREEHQLLLAESYAAVMDLTKQLQIGERNWSREKMELVETLGQERPQWEQRGGELKLQTKSKAESSCDEEATVDSAPNGSSPLRAKSMSELQNPEINGLATQEERSLSTAPPSFLFRSEFGDITGKNWSYLTNETPEVADSCKTWDGPAGPEAELDPESARKSFTAPDRTGIRIYYSPPAARRMEHLARHQAGSMEPRNGPLESGPGLGLGLLEPLDLVQKQPSSSSSYEQWLSSLSTPRGALLESRGAGALVSASAVNTNGAMADGAMDSSSSSSPASSSTSSSSSSFRGLEIGDISVNLSDDMKEMTNCVRQAIRSSSLERKSPKEPGSQMAGMATRSTQTATQYTSVGLQTDSVSTVRGPGLHSKAWSPRHTPSAVSSLASARTRQISTSLDKVHGRMDRPCCSPKYGSPKLQRRVSTGSTPRLTDGGPSRDRSLWSLQQRPLGGGGSAWARSTTTRDSPVLSGLNDGLSSLFSVVEHSGSMESLWRGDTAGGGTSIKHPLAAGRPSGPPACPAEAGPQRYGGLVQEFLRDVCGGGGRGQAGGSMPGERTVRDALRGVDEPKPECVMSGAGGTAASDNVTRIVNKRFMRHAEAPCVALGAASGTEEAPCDCAAQSLSTCLARPSRSATRHSLAHCKHRPQESPVANEERPDSCNE